MPHDAEPSYASNNREMRDHQLIEHVPSEASTLAELARGLNATVRLVEALHHEVKEFAIGQATLRLTINAMEETLRELRKAITASDPASLTIRVLILEREIADYKEWKKELDAEKHMAEQERSHAGWKIKAALGTGAISLVGSIILLLLHAVSK
jgi:chromosome segregation ATPase